MFINFQPFIDRCKGDIETFVNKLTLKDTIISIGIFLFAALAYIFRTTIDEKYTQVSQDISNFLNSLDVINSIGFAFWFSTILLIVVSFIKYFINHESGTKDWVEFVMEVPIDTCSIIITVIASMYLYLHTGKGIMLIMVTVGVASLCSYLRRKSIDNGISEKINYRCIIYGLADVIIASFWIDQVLKQLSD